MHVKVTNSSDTCERVRPKNILKQPKQTRNSGSMANPIINSKQKQICIQEDMIRIFREIGSCMKLARHE